MEERQIAEMIMESLGIGEQIFELEDAAIESKTDMLTILSLAVASGIRYERMRAGEINERKKEKKQKKERNIYNINKEKTDNLSELNLNLKSEKSIPPLEAKRQAAEKKKKKNKTAMPKAWIDAREKETIVDQVLILYAEGQGYDWYNAKELFLAFVDHHLSRGSTFVKWEAAFYTWIRNDIKWGNKPVTVKAGNVVQSYETKNPIEGLFKDD
jgi:hypothetical protein